MGTPVRLPDDSEIICATIVVVRQALRADLPTIVDIWTDAFADDPFFRWIQSDDDGWPAFAAAWFRFVTAICFERGHTHIAEGGDAAIAWLPPDITFIGADDAARGKAILTDHAGLERAEETIETMMRTRPYELVEPHWTLQYIGVRRGAQARGLGAAGATARLATCDAEGLACGLVSTNPRNVPFYERLGFVVQAEVPTPDGATALRPMHRAPNAH